MIKDYFKISFRNLKNRKLRTALTLIGIFISVATIFMLISLSLGLQNAVKQQFESLGADKFFVQPGSGFLGPPGGIGGDILTQRDAENINEVRGVKQVAYETIGNAKIEFSKKIRYNVVWGVYTGNDLYIKTGNLKLNEGKFLDKDDSGILIGNSYKTKNLFSKPVHAGDTIKINEKEFKVRGILESTGNSEDDQIIFMEMHTFRENFDIEKRVDWIIVQIDEGENLNEVAKRVEEKLRKERDVSEKTQDFSVVTPEELLGSFQSVLNIITYFLAGIAAISLVVGAIGISNTMYTSVVERTKEIGIMKAIGAKNKDIMTIFLIESGMLGLIGATIGVVLGFIITKSIEFIAITQLNTNLLQASAPAYLILGCLLFGFIIGAASGTFPAVRASKINVVDALRYE